MELEDSRILIDDAANLLEEIEILYARDIEIGEDSPLLRVRIKQFLENINSALEYAAFTAFTEFCADRVKNERANHFERIERNVYFPCKLQKDGDYGFNKYMNERYPYLDQEKPEVIDVFEKYQPFPTRSKWLSNLKDLVNSNKHRQLSKQSHRKSMHINHLLTASGGGIFGVTLEGSGSQPLISFEGEGSQPISFDGSIEYFFTFDEIDQPVLKVLRRIYKSAPLIISDLEKIF
ncbi:hypothetical protein [Priestia megaterium]|uniref:hypothetical protein n=1 Tax=Priestia megaterium TaxID=1404 RepID=UPI002E1C751B|nr:hypothetical protein [Priestia megaterium]MED4278278.1 hypothetical protein [Priestia megaterium]MED4314383.1 hypothetical protein [Priestia megaterium]